MAEKEERTLIQRMIDSIVKGTDTGSQLSESKDKVEAAVKATTPNVKSSGVNKKNSKVVKPAESNTTVPVKEKKSVFGKRSTPEEMAAMAKKFDKKK